MDVFNLLGDEWDRTEEREGWRSKDAWVGARLGGTRDARGKRLFLARPGPAADYWEGE